MRRDTIVRPDSSQSEAGLAMGYTFEARRCAMDGWTVGAFSSGLIVGLVGNLLTPIVRYWVVRIFFPSLRSRPEIRVHYVYKPPFRPDSLYRINRIFRFFSKKNNDWRIYFKAILYLCLLSIFSGPLLFIYNSIEQRAFVDGSIIFLGLGGAFWIMWIFGWGPLIYALFVWKRRVLVRRFAKARQEWSLTEILKE